MILLFFLNCTYRIDRFGYKAGTSNEEEERVYLYFTVRTLNTKKLK